MGRPWVGMGVAGQPQKRRESGQTALNDGMRQRMAGCTFGQGGMAGAKSPRQEHAGLSAEQRRGSWARNEGAKGRRSNGQWESVCTGPVGAGL